MNKTILCALIAACSFGSIDTAEAKSRKYDRGDYYDRGKKGDRHSGDRYYGGRSRSIYVIENRRPVRRSAYYDNGRYYRYYGGRRHYVTQRYYTSYPSQYYYTDGRPRIGVSIRF